MVCELYLKRAVITKKREKEKKSQRNALSFVWVCVSVLDFGLISTRIGKLSCHHKAYDLLAPPFFIHSFIHSFIFGVLWILQDIFGLPWWGSGWESACQCRGHGFEPWSGKIPHAAEQLSPCAKTTEALMPRARALQQEKPPQWEDCTPQRRVAPAHRN